MIDLVTGTAVPRKPYDDAVAESFAALKTSADVRMEMTLTARA